MEKPASREVGEIEQSIPEINTNARDTEALAVDEEDRVTPKTWLAVFSLSVSSGISIWLLPTVGNIASQIATKFNADVGASTWYVSSFSVAACIATMICGANSDLFGRRYFILGGNLGVVIGCILTGSAKSSDQFIAGMVFAGIGTGCCQMACFALPELLPTKWRPMGVVMAEAFAYVCLVVGPVVARLAIANGGSAWRWIFYPNAIANGLALLMLYFVYFPPAHPRGVPFKKAVRELDYGGILLFILSVALIMVGIVETTYLPSKSDPKIVATLCTGFGLLVVFACWETFMPLKQPLTPPRLFRNNWGRSLTAPFICGIMGGMFYLGPNILWGTMVSVFFTTPSQTSLILKLSTVQGLGITLGSLGLAVLGGRIKRWKWQMIIGYLLMTLFGGLFALCQPGRLAGSIVICVFSGMTYAWAAYLTVAYIQFGAPQIDLGIAGGLAAVTRYAGALIATTVFSTILTNTLTNEASTRVIAAAEGAGASPTAAQSLLSALSLGTDPTLVQGVTASISQAAGEAYVQSYLKATQTVAYSSIAFGMVAVIAALFLEDITPKMIPKIEVFLENDVNAQKNKFH